ncbi:transposase [Pseudovibrio sp. Tun.PSC04-5.I4]|uniref:transposase n=1 Tax=Pseudovibrio sp. Tun.PSC04-5.I4 TaxID=1798213 RepID=UPI00087E0F86|nr:transposase [Pseudovibrio sp. Tun.PSC04-5.I4]SDQ33338.1 transposase [Pseudovibrio sp. Tun.PSC04-5.I4]
MKRPTYTKWLKREARRLVEVSGRSVDEIAEDLGIARSSLHRWVREFKDQDLLAGPHEDTGKELARLLKEVELLRRERELLKKAAAFFTKETSL